ncbi:natterin-3-like [Osmerus eperlanus]|uniref:natterin-3-like n=1 Tax=Osmerus eperlanus TaxID=29151 RepID=UPI002E10E944
MDRQGSAYVGKNQYGLGKVVPIHKAFFLPWEGYEYWYKSHKVLTINKDTYTQEISHVVYAINKLKLMNNPPETMQTHRMTNNDCQTVHKTVTTTITRKKENTWIVGHSCMVGTKTTTISIPIIVEGEVELSTEQTIHYSWSTTNILENSNKISANLNVLPNHSCTVRMEGRKMTADIPYTARLSRTYRNGETHWTSISGKYNGVQIGEIDSVIDRCQPVADAKPCPRETRMF